MKTKCEAGQMCSEFGQTSNQTQLPCPIGHYCPEGTVVEVSDLIADSDIDMTDLISGPTLCEKENTGVYCELNATEPTNCPEGEWFMSTGSVDSGIDGHICIPCPDGKACTKEGIFDPDDAINCSPGYYCFKGNSVAKPDAISENGGPCR